MNIGLGSARRTILLIDADPHSRAALRLALEGAGFSVGDTLLLPEDVTAARFVGDSIVATLTAGGTVSFATATALSGSLSVNGDVITYAAAADHWHAPQIAEVAFWRGDHAF